MSLGFPHTGNRIRFGKHNLLNASGSGIKYFSFVLLLLRRMGPGFLLGFYQIDTIMVAIGMGFCELRLRDAVFHMGFIVLRGI